MRRASALSLILVSPLLFAADSFDVKTGLWEITVTTATNGMMVPQEMLDKLSPEQRERMTAAMKARAAKGPMSHTSKQCIKAEDLKKGAFGNVEGQHCTFTPTVQTSKHQAGKMACPAPGGTGEADFQALSPEQIRGTITVAMAGGSAKIDMTGRWLSASCAGADED